MAKRKNIWPGIGLVALLLAIVVASLWPHRGEIPVQVARVVRMDLTSEVRATGEIHAQTYTNVLAQNEGRVTQILVHEGELVQPGDLLLRVDSVQAAADARALQAAVDSAQAGVRAAQAGEMAAKAIAAQRQADLDKAKFDWEKNEKLYQAEVIPRKTLESMRSAYDAARAALDAAHAQLASAHSQMQRAIGRQDQAQEQLVHAEDVLRKMTYSAPIAGTVTYIGVRPGEDIVPGVPETTGAYLMTIVDMSTVNAEIRVDENSIVNLHPGQPVKIHIDAYPGRQFTGSVNQVGTQAIFANTGQATLQTVTGSDQQQQEIDYKVILAIDHLPPSVRPGMTMSAVIDTVHKSKVLAIPFQALLLRPKSEAGRTTPPKTFEAQPVSLTTNPQSPQQPRTGEQGVFIVRDGRAIFTPIKIGILGADNVEVRSGLKEGDEIAVGNYTALRELHSGMRIKVRNPPH